MCIHISIYVYILTPCNVVQGLINNKGVNIDYFFGWADFQPKRKESLLGHPGPGLDLGRGGWIKSDEILTFYTWSQGVFFFDLGVGWVGGALR